MPNQGRFTARFMATALTLMTVGIILANTRGLLSEPYSPEYQTGIVLAIGVASTAITVILTLGIALTKDLTRYIRGH